MGSTDLNVSVQVDVEVYCRSCGAHMCKHSEVEGNGNTVRVDVYACPACLDEAREEGRREAQEQNG